MKTNSLVLLSCSALLTVGAIAGCSNASNSSNPGKASDTAPFEITLTSYASSAPTGNEISQAIEKYTNTKLNIQWVPTAAYDEKVNVMIASNELPKLLRVRNDPSIRNAIQSGIFWEIGPYLKDYKNLSAQHPDNYSLSTFDEKRYGIPLFKNVGRTSIIYRKDWLDALGMKLPTNIDEWYNMLKAMTLNDPDKNGKNDTYGIVLYKNYNQGLSNLATRIAVSLGAPTKWEEQNGKFTPEFMTKVHFEVIKLFKRLYDEKLINQDFASFDEQESRNLFQAGKAGVIVNVSDNAKKFSEALQKVQPNAVVDVERLNGPAGIRVSGFPDGTSGYYLIPKDSVKTEAELRKVLDFMNKLLDPEMQTLLLRGIEGKHYKKTADNQAEFIDYNLYVKEVQVFADTLLGIEGYSALPLKDSPIGAKGTKLEMEGQKYVVPNPTLTLNSATYTERGRELDLIMEDAQTKFIMGKIDEAGYQAEIAKWQKAGGEQMIKEYEKSFAKFKK
ncbi:MULTISPECIES: extracellular solute-binding protein [unclassified Paenibacillus]|uniref:extracellular solute-binding protein n=1 Tax=unclassified Paenibacillus TaxID=185978 RepID=UPI00363370DE